MSCVEVHDCLYRRDSIKKFVSHVVEEKETSLVGKIIALIKGEFDSLFNQKRQE